MGAYTCEFGIVHKTCRCPTPHTIKCDVAWSHAALAKAKQQAPEHTCLVFEMQMDGRLNKPKHTDTHTPHDWWYTSWGGGHQMDEAPLPGDPDYNRSKKWHCPGGEYR